jgi:hypothetical protein
MTQHIVLDIDGQQHAVDADPDVPLLYALRDHLQFDNPRFGCGLGQCGASRYTSMARQRAAARQDCDPRWSWHSGGFCQVSRQSLFLGNIIACRWDECG